MSAAIIGSSFLMLGSLPAVQADAYSGTDYGLASTSQKGVILHCWNWSYKNIKKYMKDIAAAGYTSVQTSPVQQPKDYYWEGVAYGNVGIPDGTGGYEGNWWKAYQPVTFSICDNGYTWYGNKQDFIDMCAEAEKYGVKVIVDIVANHMGNIKGYKIGDVETVMGDISPQVGEFWEPKMLTDSSYWHISTSWTHTSDGRFDVTQGNMGMPDLNTGDPKVQNMVLGLLKECIACGADGFRFDAAKHIETPADDSKFASDFWDVVLDGAKKYYKEVNGNDNIYFYGEVLNRIDDTNAENYYLSKMSLTDNSTSDNLRNSVVHGSVSALATSGYCGYVHGKGDHTVMWAESHDTYMGGGSSYDANDSDIKKTWAIIASRKDSTGLFFARPYYSKDILANDVSKSRQSYATILENLGGEQTQLGDVGSLTWADPAVVAANRFRNFFVGQSEKLGSSGNTAYNMRGTTGIVIVRGEGPGSVSLSVGMKDGTYYDQVTGEKFTVSGGTVKGTIKNPDGIAVVYNPTVDYGTVTPEEPVVLKINAETADGKTSFNTNYTTVNITVKNASKATYTTSEGKKGTITNGKASVRIGTLTATGENVTLTVNAETADGITKSKTYIYGKKAPRAGYPTLNGGGVVFDNSTYNWSKVYCYVYDSNKVNNSSWPGVAMTDEGGDFWSYEIPQTLGSNVFVIFNNSEGTQYPTGEGLSMLKTEKKLFVNNALTDLPAGSNALELSLKASSTTVSAGQAVKLTATAKNADGTVKYSFIASDGTTIQSAGTASTVNWTPSKTGTYIVAVNGVDNSSDITATVKITVTGSDASLKNNSYASTDAVRAGNKIVIYGSASGGKSPYTYSYYYKKSSSKYWTLTGQEFGSASTAEITPATTCDYDIKVAVKDSNGTVLEKQFTISADPSAVANNSTISTTTPTVGSEVKITASASGGTAPYKYAYYYKKSTSAAYTKIGTEFGTATTATFKPGAAATYKVKVAIKDSTGQLSEKVFTLTAKAASTLKNTSTISATEVMRGSYVTVTSSATGGTSSYTYAFYYKKSTSSTWTTFGKEFGTAKKASFQPGAVATYNVKSVIKDSSGKKAEKVFTVKSTAASAPVNNSTISATTVSVGSTVTINGAASGGVSPYKYAYYYKKSTSSAYTKIGTEFGTALTASFKPGSKATYSVKVIVKDNNGLTSEKIFTVTSK